MPVLGCYFCPCIFHNSSPKVNGILKQNDEFTTYYFPKRQQGEAGGQKDPFFRSKQSAYPRRSEIRAAKIVLGNFQ
jgi:hypothetical protein